jgi:hypothetical protein
MVRSSMRRLGAGLGAVVVLAGLAVSTAVDAQAAVPAKWGFAFIDKPTVAGIPDLNHQAGTWPAPLHAHSAPGAPGQVTVKFPHLAAKHGIVHVTAINSGAVWCQAQKWGPSGLSEVVTVRCFKAGGAPTFSQFTVLFTTSSGGSVPAGQAYGYVHFKPGSGVVTSFNSAGGANTVTPGPTGVWKVKMAGIGSKVQVGGIQVTAVNPAAAAKCEVAAWSWKAAAQMFVVACFDGGSMPLKTGWTLSYQRKRAITGAQPKLFAYTFDNKPTLAGPYSPAPAGINFNSQAASNNVRSAGTGLRLVQFPRVGALPNTVLVTPFRVGPGFCNLLSLWATSGPNVIVRDVACYTAAGVHKSQPSLTTYTAAH